MPDSTVPDSSYPESALRDANISGEWALSQNTSVPINMPGNMSSDTLASEIVRDVIVKNENGLHARPAVKFADIANRFSSDVHVHRHADEASEAVDIDGKSVMQLLTLMALPGTKLTIRAQGVDAGSAMDELVKLIDDNFGE